MRNYQMILTISSVVMFTALTSASAAARYRESGVAPSLTSQARLTKEINELDSERVRQTVKFQQQREKTAMLKEAVGTLQDSYSEACLNHGVESDEAKAALKELESARQKWLMAQSQKDHLLYRLTIIERGIAERRSRLAANPRSTDDVSVGPLASETTVTQ